MPKNLKETLERLQPVRKLLGFVELPLLGLIELIEVIWLLLDKSFKKHAYKHWLSAVILKSLFVGLAIATATVSFLGVAGLAFPVLYLSLACLGLLIKAKTLYTEYKTKKADQDPLTAAKRRRHKWLELGLKITACVCIGLLFFLPITQKIMASALIILGFISLISALTRPKRETDWSQLSTQKADAPKHHSADAELALAPQKTLLYQAERLSTVKTDSRSQIGSLLPRPTTSTKKI